MVTFHRFPNAHWQHLRTTNPVEVSFPAARLRTDVAKRFGQVNNVTAVIRKMLLVAERVFRRLRHPELTPEVYRATQCTDGTRRNTEVAA